MPFAYFSRSHAFEYDTYYRVAKLVLYDAFVSRQHNNSHDLVLYTEILSFVFCQRFLDGLFDYLCVVPEDDDIVDEGSEDRGTPNISLAVV